MAQRQQQPIASCLLIVGSALLLVSANFASDLHSPVLFIFKALLQPITALTLVAFFIYAVWIKKALVSIATLFATLINLFFLLPNFSLATAEVSLQSHTELTVATFSTMTRTKNITDIIALIDSKNPDLLCIQELSKNHREILFERLDGHYPYLVENNSNQLTLSRFPLAPKNNLGHHHSSILRHPKWGDINIINAHMPRPYLSIKLADSWKKLFKLLEGESTIILCGDLNITPNNSLYNLLRYQYGLSDSQTSGYGFTYPSNTRRSAIFGPLIRIDYILTRGMKSSKTKTFSASNLSDHRAVITHISLDQ
ncbi:MAG: endonuclease/exonuclease/phosphatase (EEP) superfamily protein YafD [Arenicella sp.]|jgi:endonuclease/exonuclease/phosphatase (EEP) superfamily protein YafD